jgi:hypothetical protein
MRHGTRRAAPDHDGDREDAGATGRVIKRHWVKDRRSACLSLNKSGEARVPKIDKRVRQVEATLAEEDRRA